MFPRYRRVILEKLKRTAGMPDLEERIVFERALTPKDIDDRYKVLNGAIYGLSSHGRWNGAFKPSNRRRNPDGLFWLAGRLTLDPGCPWC
jgi:diapolycopene oxygenase